MSRRLRSTERTTCTLQQYFSLNNRAGLVFLVACCRGKTAKIRINAKSHTSRANVTAKKIDREYMVEIFFFKRHIVSLCVSVY